MDEVLVQLVTGSRNIDTAIVAELEDDDFIVLIIADTVCFFQIVSVLQTVPVARVPAAPPAPPLRPVAGWPAPRWR